MRATALASPHVDRAHCAVCHGDHGDGDCAGWKAIEALVLLVEARGAGPVQALVPQLEACMTEIADGRRA